MTVPHVLQYFCLIMTTQFTFFMLTAIQKTALNKFYSYTSQFFLIKMPRLSQIFYNFSKNTKNRSKRAIVGGGFSHAVGVAMALKRKGSKRRVWCFVGDMAFETGEFHLCHKYAKNFDLPLQFVVEDNNLSTNTPTDVTWGTKQEVPEDVIYYEYERGYPHHGAGNWVLF